MFFRRKSKKGLQKTTQDRSETINLSMMTLNQMREAAGLQPVEIQTNDPALQKGFEGNFQNPGWETDEEAEIGGKAFYLCDASKNTGCRKTHCHLFGGPCRATSNLDCAYTEYGERPDEHVKMLYKFISKDEVKKIPFPGSTERKERKRCEYCGCVAEKDYGTCDHCGAPL